MGLTIGLSNECVRIARTKREMNDKNSAHYNCFRR